MGGASEAREATATTLRELQHDVVGHQVKDNLLLEIAETAQKLTAAVEGGAPRSRPVDRHEAPAVRGASGSRTQVPAMAVDGPACSSFEGAGAEVSAACTTLGLEGLVAKRLDHGQHRRPRRS